MISIIVIDVLIVIVMFTLRVCPTTTSTTIPITTVRYDVSLVGVRGDEEHLEAFVFEVLGV